MFKQISYRIAAQFTAFVFVLLLVNGAVFLAADIGNARRDSRARIQRTADQVLSQLAQFPRGAWSIPPNLRERIRILDADKKTLVDGAFFENMEVPVHDGIVRLTVGDEDHLLLTVPLTAEGQLLGYLQIAEMERLPLRGLPGRILLYMLVSAGISALTYGVGLFFARSSLKPAEDMVAKLEQFTQDASHELRTPIAALSSSLDLALKTKKYEEGIRSAKEDLTDISSLVERLLEIARLEKGTIQKETVELSDVLQETTKRHAALAAERSVLIATNIAPGITVPGDAGLLRQVIGNLLSNAIKFTKPEGGTVTVTLNRKSFSVSDDGIGIAKSELGKIFDRFYQAENSRSNDGYGLGLSLVKRIVDLHGWTIGVESASGKGTTFTVSFA